MLDIYFLKQGFFTKADYDLLLDIPFHTHGRSNGLLKENWESVVPNQIKFTRHEVLWNKRLVSQLTVNHVAHCRHNFNMMATSFASHLQPGPSDCCTMMNRCASCFTNQAPSWGHRVELHRGKCSKSCLDVTKHLGWMNFIQNDHSYKK